tara:strand:+ start:1844 stop:2554 length:711 start_codon:yes stop_codon:yes gene_type:complete
MSITQKLKWKRSLSHLRFCHEESSLIKEISHGAGAEFQKYYEVFCAKNDIDIPKSNEENRERIDELYGKKHPAGTHDDETDIDKTDETAIAVHGRDTSDNPEQEKEYQMSRDEIEVHNAFSKLFKKIAVAIHPDKIDKNLPEEQIVDMVSMFQDANRAMDERKYFVLLDIAEKLNITTPKNYSQQTRWMKREVSLIEQSISKEKTTYNYLFSEAESDEDRDAIIKKFLFQLFRIQL